MLSTMSATLVDATCSRRISGFARRILRGGEITRGEAAWLFSLESSADIFDLMAGANRLRSFEMRKSVLIILRFKFAQTEKCPRRTYLRRE